MRTVNRVGNDLQVAADSVQSTTTIVNQETLPQINGLARVTPGGAQHRPRRQPVQRQAKQRAVRWTIATPGPGEPGFKAP
jgi:phospholipid/cholesterol/gamma-HCH transport system substrate-binding protein